MFSIIIASDGIVEANTGRILSITCTFLVVSRDEYTPLLHTLNNYEYDSRSRFLAIMKSRLTVQNKVSLLRLKLLATVMNTRLCLYLIDCLAARINKAFRYVHSKSAVNIRDLYRQGRQRNSTTFDPARIILYAG